MSSIRTLRSRDVWKGPVSLRNGDHRLSPFKDFSALASGELEPAELRERLVKCGVSELIVSAEN